MTWTKLDSSLPDDPGILQLPRGIRWMHVEGLVWCNDQGTDGHIPDYAIRRVTDEDDPRGAADQLVKVGLWEVTEGGWLITDFLRDQPSAADVERTQALGRDRARRQRQHRNGDHSLCEPRFCQQASRVTNAVSSGVSHDPRPDPTRPVPKELREGEGGKGASASRGGSAALATPPAPTPHEDEGQGNGTTPDWTPPGGLPAGVVPSINGVPWTETS